MNVKNAEGAFRFNTGVPFFINKEANTMKEKRSDTLNRELDRISGSTFNDAAVKQLQLLIADTLIEILKRVEMKEVK